MNTKTNMLNTFIHSLKMNHQNISSTLFLSLFIILLSGSLSVNSAHSEIKAALAAETAPDEVHRVVEQMPEIVGGIEELYQHLEYPQSAIRAEIEGRVVIQFVVDQNGNIHNPEILRDIGAGCGEAAIDAVQNVEFTPGKQDGEAVSVIYSLPITFRLE